MHQHGRAIAGILLREEDTFSRMDVLWFSLMTANLLVHDILSASLDCVVFWLVVLTAGRVRLYMLALFVLLLRNGSCGPPSLRMTARVWL